MGKVNASLDVLIEEVKKRPVLWDKKHENHSNRKCLWQEWYHISQKLNKSIDEVKSKWRNLKDTFHREEKRLELPPYDEGKPIMTYYTGQWVKFEKLLFLHNTRIPTNPQANMESQLEVQPEDIKEEIEIIEHTYDYSILDEESTSKWDHRVKNSDSDCGSSIMTVEDSQMYPIVSIGTDSTRARKKRATNTKDDSSKRIKTERISMNIDLDEDMLVKSLVPFLKKLNPIRKLMVRNELQNLLLKELLCDNCKTEGLQPNCNCNLN